MKIKVITKHKNCWLIAEWWSNFMTNKGSTIQDAMEKYQFEYLSNDEAGFVIFKSKEAYVRFVLEWA